MGVQLKRAEKFIIPILDILQTVPAFAYLLLILMLFGFGTVVGLIASVFIPFSHGANTIIGLRRVPLEIIESGLMSEQPKDNYFGKSNSECQKQLLLGSIRPRWPLSVW